MELCIVKLDWYKGFFLSKSNVTVAIKLWQIVISIQCVYTNRQLENTSLTLQSTFNLIFFSPVSTIVRSASRTYVMLIEKILSVRRLHVLSAFIRLSQIYSLKRLLLHTYFKYSFHIWIKKFNSSLFHH